jgi:hypothetical protein
MQARETGTAPAQPADAERPEPRRVRIHKYVETEPPGQLVRVLLQPDETGQPQPVPARPAEPA